MDLVLTEREAAFRAEARAWLRANVPTHLPSSGSKEGFAAHVAWEKQLFAAGWAAVSWPVEYGGRGASNLEWCLFEEEYYRAGAPPRVTQNGIFLLAPALFEFGTAEQKQRLLRPMAVGAYPNYATSTLWGILAIATVMVVIPRTLPIWITIYAAIVVVVVVLTPVVRPASDLPTWFHQSLAIVDRKGAFLARIGDPSFGKLAA